MYTPCIILSFPYSITHKPLMFTGAQFDTVGAGGTNEYHATNSILLENAMELVR
ncbi:MAG: hypothetical protein ACI83D_000161 [Planctomycetota bacterium]|jgi:hypothetical protein